jgi:hypothetical protein
MTSTLSHYIQTMIHHGFGGFHHWAVLLLEHTRSSNTPPDHVGLLEPRTTRLLLLHPPLRQSQNNPDFWAATTNPRLATPFQTSPYLAIDIFDIYEIANMAQTTTVGTYTPPSHIEALNELLALANTTDNNLSLETAYLIAIFLPRHTIIDTLTGLRSMTPQTSLAHVNAIIDHVIDAYNPYDHIVGSVDRRVAYSNPGTNADPAQADLLRAYPTYDPSNVDPTTTWIPDLRDLPTVEALLAQAIAAKHTRGAYCQFTRTLASNAHSRSARNQAAAQQNLQEKYVTSLRTVHEIRQDDLNELKEDIENEEAVLAAHRVATETARANREVACNQQDLATSSLEARIRRSQECANHVTNQRYRSLQETAATLPVGLRVNIGGQCTVLLCVNALYSNCNHDQCPYELCHDLDLIPPASIQAAASNVTRDDHIGGTLPYDAIATIPDRSQTALFANIADNPLGDLPTSGDITTTNAATHFIEQQQNNLNAHCLPDNAPDLTSPGVKPRTPTSKETRPRTSHIPLTTAQCRLLRETGGRRELIATLHPRIEATWTQNHAHNDGNTIVTLTHTASDDVLLTRATRAVRTQIETMHHEAIARRRAPSHVPPNQPQQVPRQHRPNAPSTPQLHASHRSTSRHSTRTRTPTDETSTHRATRFNIGPPTPCRDHYSAAGCRFGSRCHRAHAHDETRAQIEARNRDASSRPNKRQRQKKQ